MQRSLDEEWQSKPCNPEQLVPTSGSGRARGRCPGSAEAVCRSCWRSVRIAASPYGSRCPRCGARVRQLHASAEPYLETPTRGAECPMTAGGSPDVASG